MELAKINKFALDLSTAEELFTYTYNGAAPREIMARINLGDDDGPIAGGGAYILLPAINGVPISPSTSVQVGASVTKTVLISRPLPLEQGDVLTLTVTGVVSDTSVNASISLRDVTPLRIAELTGSGAVEVDHNHGGEDAMTYRTPDGAGIIGALIQVYLTSDYDTRNRGNAFVIARTETGADGRWKRPLMLSPGTYTAIFFRQGAYGPNRVDFTVE